MAQGMVVKNLFSHFLSHSVGILSGWHFVRWNFVLPPKDAPTMAFRRVAQPAAALQLGYEEMEREWGKEEEMEREWGN